MADKKSASVTMRVRVGEMELEVTGPSDFVEMKINEFLSRTGSKSVIPATKAVSASEPGTSVAGLDIQKAMSLGQLLKRAKPKTDTDRVLVAAFYLERYEKAESYTAAELTASIKKARTAPPRNTSDVVNKNIKKGYMMASGDKEKRIAYVLTTDGEQAATDLLSHTE